MKKFVAMMMVVLMMICGVALAEEPTNKDVVIETITETVGMEPTETEFISLVSMVYDLDTESPTDFLYGEIFDDCGFIIEYTDSEGNHYHWLMENESYAESCAMVLACLTVPYDNDAVCACTLVFGTYVYGLAPFGEYYDNTDEFAADMAIKMATYMTANSL